MVGLDPTPSLVTGTTSEQPVHDSLGPISPTLKHHWAEHFAMPCPA